MVIQWLVVSLVLVFLHVLHVSACVWLVGVRLIGYSESPIDVYVSINYFMSLYISPCDE